MAYMHLAFVGVTHTGRNTPDLAQRYVLVSESYDTKLTRQEALLMLRADKSPEGVARLNSASRTTSDVYLYQTDRDVVEADPTDARSFETASGWCATREEASALSAY